MLCECWWNKVCLEEKLWVSAILVLECMTMKDWLTMQRGKDGKGCGLWALMQFHDLFYVHQCNLRCEVRFSWILVPVVSLIIWGKIALCLMYYLIIHVLALLSKSALSEIIGTLDPLQFWLQQNNFDPEYIFEGIMKTKRGPGLKLVAYLVMTPLNTMVFLTIR